MKIPVHEKPQPVNNFERLDMLWERYPRYHEPVLFSTLEALLEEHASWPEEFTEELREEYERNQYEQFLIQLSWNDLPYRYETKKLIEQHGPFRENPYAKAFLDQFAQIDPDHEACFLFPESFVSQFFVILEVCRKAKIFHPINNLFPDEDKTHYLAVFDKENMDDVLLMYHLLYTNTSEDLYGGYSLYDYSLGWYQNHLRVKDQVLRSPYLPDYVATYQGALPYYHNPSKTVYVRRNIAHMIESGYFEDELEMFYQLTKVIMPFFEWWYQDISLYEEKDGFQSDWRLRRTRIRSELTDKGIIKPRWKHELTLFQSVRRMYPDTLYQYRPDWLGLQSVDLYIPSLCTAIEYQGIQHYMPVEFFGGMEALDKRRELDQIKKKLCEENAVRLIEWPYSLEPSEKIIREVLKGEMSMDEMIEKYSRLKKKLDPLAEFLRLSDFDEYMARFEEFCFLPHEGAAFAKEEKLMESDETYTHREKEKIREKKKRETVQALKQSIAKLLDETEQKGIWILPVKGRTMLEYRYTYPSGKNGDISHYLCGMKYDPKRIKENEYSVKIRRRDYQLVELLKMGRQIFTDYDPEDDDPLMEFLIETNRIAKIEYLMAKVNCYKEEYRSLRSIEDVRFRKTIEKYHKDLNAKRNEIYEYMIAEGMSNPRWKSEQKAYTIVLKHYPDAKFQYQPDFLFGQRIDIFIPSLNAAVEYQGRQHYKPVDFFGGDKGQRDNAIRDMRKFKRCRANGIRIVYWDYDKPLNDEYFQNVIMPLLQNDEAAQKDSSED